MRSKPLINNLKTARKIIYTLGILLIITIFTFLYSLGLFRVSPSFRQPIYHKPAIDYIDAFRDDWDFRKKVQFIWYDADTIRRYLDTVFTDWTLKMNSRLPKGVDTSNAKWGIAFYPMRRTDSEGYKNRVNFLVVPTIMYQIGKSSDTFFLDYHDDKNFKSYYSRNFSINGLCDDCYGYDAGNMWP